MKKTGIIIIIFFCTALIYADSSSENLKIKVFEPVNINGARQWMLIRGNDESRPVLLYLHGGPGSSLVPFAYKATGKLVNHCIVVYWDQRGAGLSYDGHIPQSTMNIEQFIKDTKAVTEYLKKKYGKKKIFILGHSWGSTLGTMVVSRYPDDYYAYIGVGQVVKPEEQERLGVQWLKKKLIEEGSAEERGKISSMERSNWTNRQLLKKYGGVVHNIPQSAVSEIMHNSPYNPDKYTGDLYSKGLKFASNLHEEVKSIDFFKSVPEIKVPVYMFLGVYDYVTPAEPSVRYFNLLKAPYKEIIWFKNSAHRMDIEEPDIFQDEIIKILNRT